MAQKSFKSFISIDTTKLPGVFGSIGDPKKDVTKPKGDDKPVDLTKSPTYQLHIANQKAAAAQAKIQAKREHETHTLEMQSKKKELAAEPEEAKGQEQFPHAEKHDKETHKAELELIKAKVSTEKARAKAVAKGSKKKLSEGVDKTPHIFCSIGKRKNLSLKEWWEAATPKSEHDKLPDVEKHTAHSWKGSKQGFPSHDDEHKQLVKDLHNHYHGDPEVHKAKSNDYQLRGYTGDSKRLNEHLVNMHHEGLFADDKGEYEQARERSKNSYSIPDHSAMKELDSSITKYANPAPHDFHVYSGVGAGFDISKLRAHSKDQLAHLPAYTSTSLAPHEAASFAGKKPDYHTGETHHEMIRLKIPQGSKHGTYVGDTGSLGDEKEFLLHRGQTIKFNGEPRVFVQKIAETARKYTIHDAEIVHHGE